LINSLLETKLICMDKTNFSYKLDFNYFSLKVHSQNEKCPKPSGRKNIRNKTKIVNYLKSYYLDRFFCVILPQKSYQNFIKSGVHSIILINFTEKFNIF